MSDPLIAQITAFGGTFAPSGWEFCNGSLLSISKYSALYSLLGTNYGGDGRTTVGMPDLRGRSPLGYGAGPGRTPRTSIGQTGGYETVTLQTSQMPSHTHDFSDATLSGDIACTLNAAETEGDETNASGAMLADQGARATTGTMVYSKKTDKIVTLSDKSIVVDHSLHLSGEQLDPTGGGGVHENMHPWICLNYIIALEGLYPSRK
jgi:microcystin-dependent protein